MDKEISNESTKNVLFRTSFSGYNKQDVNDYIARLVRDNQKDIENYISHIRSLEEERTENAKKILELSEKNETLTGLVEAEAEGRLDIEKKYEAMREQNRKTIEEVDFIRNKLMSIRDDMRGELSDKSEECDIDSKEPEEDPLIKKLEDELKEKNSRIDFLESSISQINEEQSAELSKKDEKISALEEEIAQLKEKADIPKLDLSLDNGDLENNDAFSDDYIEVKNSIERLESILKDLDV